MNINNLILASTSQLNLTSPTPRVDAEILLAAAIGKTKEYLYAHPEYLPTAQQFNIFANYLKQRISGEPIAYILGHREFWSLDLLVNKNVLIPRPETELLMEITLQKVNKPHARIMDLGTGSGAIALALAKEQPTWEIIAVDNSEAALTVARENAKHLNLTNVTFYLSDWLQNLPSTLLCDAIVSNPPYIAANDIHLLQGDVRFEPQTALVSGDGLQDLRKVIQQAPTKLIKGGWLILEHGYDQQTQLMSLLQQHNFSALSSYKDLAGLDRAVCGKL
jgi:release factor glutamine methyltransferase